MNYRQKAFDFLKAHPDLAFATIGEDNKPKLRVFQIMKQQDGTLYFATSSQKEVYQQLHINPYVELLAMDNNISVRISGKVIFDVDEIVAKQIYDKNQVLQRIYNNYTELTYFRLMIEKMDYYDLSSTPPLLVNIESEEIE